MSLLATPFHARAAESNRLNAWENRGGFTLASHHGDVAEEALAARFGAVLGDVSWHWRVEFAGAGAAEFARRAFTRDVAALAPGAALEVLWLNDAGAVRGAGTLVRLAPDRFLLISPLEDMNWFAAAAALYGVETRERTTEQGVATLIGPAAPKILAAAGFASHPAPYGLLKLSWRGFDVTLAQFGLGFEVWCEPDDGLIVWDRLMAAGRAFALLPAGQAALDILETENGIMRAGRDYVPARDGFVGHLTPQDLGLCALIDRTHQFNGRPGYLAAGTETVLCGILVDGTAPAAYAPLLHEGREVGRTLGSRYSPAMQQTVAFAVLPEPWPAGPVAVNAMECRPVPLPFLPMAVSATESAVAAV